MRTGKLVRWGVPVAAVAVIGAAVAAGPVVAAVGADPVLPGKTASQLLADAAAASRDGKGLPPMSGTVTKTASLGLPALPGGPESPAALLTGAHELKVWYGSRDRVRLAVPEEMSEKNFIYDGTQAWLWDSSTNTATKFKLPAGTAEQPPAPKPSDLTPQQVAEKVLNQAEQHSTVSVSGNDKVAGRAVYQLSLVPKDAGTLVQEVRVALDGETYLPMRVQLYAKGSAEPAFEVGFTEVNFTAPAEENFTFTPPAGVKVEERPLDLGALAEHQADQATPAIKTLGSGWSTVAALPYQRSESFDELLSAAKPVSGTWGSGKLITSKLLTVLVTDDGRILAGAVTPDKLVETAGQR
ncbi:DUF2092 domain-containing protein [Nonomuraea sp. NPDC050310]|uniref:LolA family protein n=1 Tax=unclassified Nonomuraea TaxID=2593643 RepID=UPI003405ABDC